MSSQTPLTDKQRSFIHLILRSEDAGDGWRKVSKQVWPLVAMVALPSDLLEIEPSGEAGRVRLTPNGNTVARYL